MNFESALRLLAEKEPEKFAIWTRKSLGVDEFVVLSSGDCFRFDRMPDSFTQDDIDAILAEIGWAYNVVPHYPEREWRWFGLKLDSWGTSWTLHGLHKSKILAARAALIAVVEKLYGAEITAIREGKK